MQNMTARTIFAVVGCVLALGVYAQDKSRAGLSSGDRSFVMQAMNGGMTEIELSKIALQNGAKADVKAFAQRLVEDHEKAGKELQALAAKLGAAPPKPPKQTDLKRFAQLKGDKLDSAYVERMVKDHKATIALFQKQAKSGRSEELKQFASNTLPTLQGHLKMAMTLAEKSK